MPVPPSPRRGDPLPDDHPLRYVTRENLAETEGVPPVDCIADVDPVVLDEVAAWHDGDDPPDVQVDPRELV
jgi:hypothetical protein